MRTQTYPTDATGQREIVTFQYDSYGTQARGLSGQVPYASAVRYNEHGQLLQVQLDTRPLAQSDPPPPVVQLIFDYYPLTTPGGAGRLWAIRAGTGDHPYADLYNVGFHAADGTPGYDAVGNLLTVRERNGGQTQHFRYDAQDRLTSAEAVGGQ